MKIAVRGGHNYQSQGAISILNEVTENRKIYPKVIEYLQLDGQTVIDVTPGNMDATSDLIEGVSRANEANVDLFVSIHLNSGGGNGAEVLYYPSNHVGQEVATRIASKITSIGFVNRGAKEDVRGLYELRATNMTANIVECFFIDSRNDVNIYNNVGVNALAKVIAEGIVGHDIQTSTGLILPEGFNEEYYLWKYPDVKEAVKRGAISSGAYHYVYYGSIEGREFKPTIPEDFTEGDYLLTNPDIESAVKKGEIPSGSWHWLVQGWKEGRSYKSSIGSSGENNTYTITNNDKKTPISGSSQVSIEQMVTFLIKQNPSPKINGTNPLEFCKIYLEEGAIEGVCGDIAFCQSILETGWFKFTGDVVPKQNNYAGIGSVGGGANGVYFETQREGIRAQIQHLKAYASTELLKRATVDPRYYLVTKGSATNWEDLGGKWSVPGFLKSKFNTFKEAYEAKETYGQQIVALYNLMKNTSVDEKVIKGFLKAYKVTVTLYDKSEADKCKSLLEQNGFKAEIV